MALPQKIAQAARKLLFISVVGQSDDNAELEAAAEAEAEASSPAASPAQIHINYIYIYVYMYVCLCDCASMGAPLITAHHLLTRVPATEATADLIEYKKEEEDRERKSERV